MFSTFCFWNFLWLFFHSFFPPILLFVEMWKCSCFLRKTSLEYLKVSFEKHKKTSMLVKSLLFRLTWLQDFSCLLLDIQRKFSNAWSLSSSFSLFCFFWYFYLSGSQSNDSWSFHHKFSGDTTMESFNFLDQTSFRFFWSSYSCFFNFPCL